MVADSVRNPPFVAGEYSQVKCIAQQCIGPVEEIVAHAQENMREIPGQHNKDHPARREQGEERDEVQRDDSVAQCKHSCSRCGQLHRGGTSGCLCAQGFQRTGPHTGVKTIGRPLVRLRNGWPWERSRIADLVFREDGANACNVQVVRFKGGGAVGAARELEKARAARMGRQIRRQVVHPTVDSPQM